MTDLTNETILQAFSLYDLGNVQIKPQFIQGDVDLNYKIITENNAYLLKYIVDASSLTQFEFLGSLHEYLKSKGIVVPKVYKTKNNTYVGNSFILYEFIDGIAKREWTDTEIISLVTNFTKLLLALKKYPVPDVIKNKNDQYIKGGNIEYCYEIFKPHVAVLPISNEIKMPIIETIDKLHGIFPDFKQLPKQLIHGDLNESNALFKNGKNVGIIDLALSYDPLIYDLGEFCYWIAFPWWTKKFNQDRFKLIVDTFQRNIPLSSIELKLLPYMVLRRSMMDIMITLQYYWSNKEKVNVPEKRLKEQIERNTKILDLIYDSHKKS